MPSEPDTKSLVKSPDTFINLDPLGTLQAEGFHVAWLRGGNLPLTPAARIHWADALLGLRERAQTVTGQTLLWEPYLQMNQLERPEGPRTISRNGSRWMPMLTAGVWPDRESPKPLNADDFHNMVPGVPMREPYFHLMRVSAPDEGVRLEAARAVAGTGALLLTLVDGASLAVDRADITERLRAQMTHEEMLDYAAYFPLLDLDSIRNVAPGVLDDLLRGVVLYIREDTDEHAALLISRLPLDVLFGTPALTP